MKGIERRQFLSLLAAGMATPFVVTLLSGRAEASFVRSEGLRIDTNGQVFSHSVASGDPTASGVVLWTRINPSAVRSGQNLYVQVSQDANFELISFESLVEPQHLKPGKDYTISIDTHSFLQPSTRYFYRFVYGQTSSPVGRCRTAPDFADDNQPLKLAVLTCQDYTNGYFSALELIAQDDSIDFVVHLGDFIYETVGDPTFQKLPFPDRKIELPSGSVAALDLEDYRHLYKTVRNDPCLKRAMEQHTFIITRDDHETANDAYWDYERHTLGAPDHPFTVEPEYANSAERLNGLMLDSQRAWLEYIPARVKVDTTSTDPHKYLQYYRHVQLGGLVDLFMLDGRTYRSPHPCGEGLFGQRYLPLSCRDWRSDQQTLLGTEQRDWLINGIIESSTKWQLIGNQTFMGRLSLEVGGKQYPINTDAWDGYTWERNYIANELSQRKDNNVIVITGDLHSYIASHLKKNYRNINPFDFDNFIGVEFMTPALTSAGLIEQLAGTKLKLSERQLAQALSNSAVRLTNPHIRYFNSVYHGFSTIEFYPDYCDWKAFAIDKNQPIDLPKAKLLRHYRKHKAWPWLITRAAFV